jgi:hypothetical protein
MQGQNLLFVLSREKGDTCPVHPFTLHRRYQLILSKRDRMYLFLSESVRFTSLSCHKGQEILLYLFLLKTGDTFSSRSTAKNFHLYFKDKRFIYNSKGSKGTGKPRLFHSKHEIPLKPSTRDKQTFRFVHRRQEISLNPFTRDRELFRFIQYGQEISRNTFARDRETCFFHRGQEKPLNLSQRAGKPFASFTLDRGNL